MSSAAISNIRIAEVAEHRCTVVELFKAYSEPRRADLTGTSGRYFPINSSLFITHIPFKNLLLYYVEHTDVVNQKRVADSLERFLCRYMFRRSVAAGENIVFCDLSGLERLHYIDLNTGVGRVKRCALCLRQGLRRLWSRDILTK